MKSQGFFHVPKPWGFSNYRISILVFAGKWPTQRIQSLFIVPSKNLPFQRWNPLKAVTFESMIFRTSWDWWDMQHKTLTSQNQTPIRKIPILRPFPSGDIANVAGQRKEARTRARGRYQRPCCWLCQEVDFFRGYHCVITCWSWIPGVSS